MISSQGNIKLKQLLSPIDKRRIEKYSKKHSVKSEADVLNGLVRIFGRINKSNAIEYDPTNGSVHLANSETTYNYYNESEMFITEGNKDHPEFTNLSLKGWAAYNYVGLLSFPKENKYEKELEMTLCELYRLPLPESRQFIAFKILAENDFSVMVERKVWIELERVLKPDKLHRILPKHTDYYYSFGHWERYNKLVREIEAVISDEEIKESEKDQFFEELIALRDKFRKELETSFNFRNSLIYERSPFVYGMILRHNYRKHYRTIKEDVQYQIKTRHIGELKVKVNNDLSYALVFVNLYYDLKKALSPESGKRGGQYVPPKEAIADYTLPVNEIVKRLGISHPRYWTVRLLNSFVKHRCLL